MARTYISLLRLAATPPGVGYAGAQVLSTLLNVAQPVLLGLVVGSALPALGHGLGSAAARRLLVAFGLLCAQYLVQTLVSERAIPVLRYSCQRRVDGHVRELVRAWSNAPTTIAHLEDPAQLDRVGHALDGRLGLTIGGAAVTAIDRGMGVASSVMLAAIVAHFAPALAGGVLVLALLLRTQVNSAVVPVGAAQAGSQEGFRRASYLQGCASSAGSAKEVRVFGLERFFGSAFVSAQLAAHRPVWEAMGRLQAALVGINVVYSSLFAASFAYPVYQAAHGRLSVGGLTAVIFAMASLFMAQADPRVAQIADAVAAARWLESTTRAASGSRAGRGAELPPFAPAREVSFEGVSFEYPGTGRRVFDCLDLTMQAGRSLAIVGVNGAGKTTLVKLLAGLYEPDTGTISVDGTDIASVDPDSWRARLAVLFQDFVHLELSASDNVELGRLERYGDHTARDEAASKAGAAGIVASLPNGWDTVLARGYPGGVDLSGGQWQRIALARALFALAGGARVLVLDEPTANLDVRAEAELFETLLRLTKGFTTILISHRFSSVRHADRIVVLDAGRVLEDGTHEELLARGGEYAHLFRLQAARFTDALPQAPSPEVVDG